MDKQILPENFDGVFRFTNWTDEDFKAKWDSVEYTFPKRSTTPLIIPNATPVEIQNIRKKFAKELGVAAFYGSDKFKKMNDVPEGGTPALYTDADLVPFIQRCLEPLPVAQAKVKILPKDDESRYSKNSKGKPVTRVLQEDESLMSQASEAIE